MPAPTPIDIRYGSPTDLGRLAAATGTAGYRLESQQRDQDMWLQRANMDNQFLMSEANRRSEEATQDALMHFRYGEAARDQSNTDRAFGLQSAVAEDRSSRGYANMGSREEIAAAERAAAEQRLQQTLAARRSGSARSGRAASDLSLVPATGDIPSQSAEEPTAQIISRDGGTSIERYRGRNISYNDDASRNLSRGAVDSEQPADMVPRYVRQQLDYIESLKGSLPEDRLNALRIAARSGELKMDQLNDDARGYMPRNPSVARDLASKEAEKMGLQIKQIDAMLTDPNVSDAVRASYARQSLHLDPLLNRNDAKAIMELKNHRAALGSRLAATKPMTNSSGRTPTGGNVTTIDSQEEFDSLPSGAYYRDAQSGQLERKP